MPYYLTYTAGQTLINFLEDTILIRPSKLNDICDGYFQDQDSQTDKTLVGTRMFLNLPAISWAGSMKMEGFEFFLDPGADVTGDLFGGVHM